MSFKNHFLDQGLSYSAHKGFNLCSGQADSLLPTATTVRKATKFCLCLMMSARSGLHLPWQMDVNCILIRFKNSRQCSG